MGQLARAMAARGGGASSDKLKGRDMANEDNDLPACKEDGCDCNGFIRNPLVSTDCLECHHDFMKHRRSGTPDGASE